jgi:hypothetical protein
MSKELAVAEGWSDPNDVEIMAEAVRVVERSTRRMITAGAYLPRGVIGVPMGEALHSVFIGDLVCVLEGKVPAVRTSLHLTPEPETCECGTGNNAVGPGHSTWCRRYRA